MQVTMHCIKEWELENIDVLFADDRLRERFGEIRASKEHLMDSIKSKHDDWI